MAPSSTPTLVSSSARLGGILALAERSERYRELEGRLEARESLVVAEATAGGRAFAWSALVAQGGRNVALIAPGEDRADLLTRSS